MATQKEATVEALRDAGHRITKVRRLIWHILKEEGAPLSALEIGGIFAEAGVRVNKTTIYRELEFFVLQGLARMVDFGDQVRRYEMTGKAHHHHAVCTKCGTVEDVELKGDLRIEERKLERDLKFQIAKHSLEFFGLCAKCALK